jgi:hypothetical protein
MQSFRKSIEFFSEEKYRDLDYGTVYYVASRQTPELNEYVKTHADQIAEQINSNESNWITCKIVYLEEDNPLFQATKKATLYSAMLPFDGLDDDIPAFFVAHLDIDDTELIGQVISGYYSTLQQMLDEVLDQGKFQDYHLRQAIVSADNSGIRFSISRKQDNEVMFSITPKPFPFTELSRLVITPLTYTVLLLDYDREIHFTAQVKALYCLFLNHPEGIRMKEISDYKEEYIHIYFCLTNRSDTDKLRESVNKLLDVCTPNALNVKKSQCNSAIRRAIPNDNLCKHYEIEANYGLPHIINLDRSLVTMPDILKAK